MQKQHITENYIQNKIPKKSYNFKTNYNNCNFFILLFTIRENNFKLCAKGKWISHFIYLFFHCKFKLLLDIIFHASGRVIRISTYSCHIFRKTIGRLLRWKEVRNVVDSWRGRPMSAGDWRHEVRRRYHDGAGAQTSAMESSQHVHSALQEYHATTAEPPSKHSKTISILSMVDNFLDVWQTFTSPLCIFLDQSVRSYDFTELFTVKKSISSTDLI